MNRSQRQLHAWTWTVLAILIVSISLGALGVQQQTAAETRAWATKAGPR